MSCSALIPAGAFQTIRSAYQTSANASGLVAGAAALLARSRENRRNAAALEGAAGAHSTKLLALRAEVASSPNLTPAANKVKAQRGFLAGHRAGLVMLGRLKPHAVVNPLSVAE